MSEILVNKLTGTSTAGSILVTGEGNSTTTNLQQGLAKAWFCYYQDVDTIGDSFNIASMTDEAAGHWYGNFTSNMANKNFAQPLMTHGYRTRYENNDPANDSTTARTVTCEAYNSSGTAVDGFSTLTVNGDLA